MMRRRQTISALAVMGLLCLGALTLAPEAKGAEPPRIDIGAVQTMLGSPDLIIIDVRQPRDWGKSDAKIKGAVREDPNAVKSWMAKYPKDKKIVLYCA